MPAVTTVSIKGLNNRGFRLVLEANVKEKKKKLDFELHPAIRVFEEHKDSSLFGQRCSKCKSGRIH